MVGHLHFCLVNSPSFPTHCPGKGGGGDSGAYNCLQRMKNGLEFVKVYFTKCNNQLAFTKTFLPKFPLCGNDNSTLLSESSQKQSSSVSHVQAVLVPQNYKRKTGCHCLIISKFLICSPCSSYELQGKFLGRTCKMSLSHMLLVYYLANSSGGDLFM